MKKGTKIIFITVSILTIVFVITLCLSYAKYGIEYTWNYYLESKGFYFTSNILTSKDNVDTMWNGKEKSFEVYNYDKRNVTEFDITYEASCSVLNNDNVGCFIENEEVYKGILSSNNECQNTKDDKDVTAYSKSECEISGYEYLTTQSESNLNITLDEDLDYAEIEVTIKSISPYKKTITGIYKLTKKPTIDIEYTFNNNILNIKNNGTDKCLKLSWNAEKARIDYNGLDKVNTDSNGYINAINFDIKTGGTLEYKFYEVNVSEPLIKDNFKIEQSYEC